MKLDKADPRKHIARNTYLYTQHVKTLREKGQMVASRGMLSSELDHRTLEVECGETYKRMDEMNQLTRMMAEREDMHIETSEDGRITKIICRRDPEFLQGREEFFQVQEDGSRVPLTEAQLDEIAGITHNAEDVYVSQEVELVSGEVDSEAHTPRDMYDVTFDASEYLQQVQMTDWREIPQEDRAAHLEYLQDEFIYSADWFPSRSDKRFHTARVREILDLIKEKDLNKKQIMELLGEKKDARPEMIRALVREVAALPPGKKRAALMKRIQLIKQSRISDIRRMRNRTSKALQECINKRMELREEASQPQNRDWFSNAISLQKKAALVREYRSLGECPTTMSIKTKGSLPLGSDKSHVWDAWMYKEAYTKGGVQLTSWQFQKRLSASLLKKVGEGLLTEEEAEVQLQLRMEKLYDVKDACLMRPTKKSNREFKVEVLKK